jgi:hypothetical protein
LPFRSAFPVATPPMPFFAKPVCRRRFDAPKTRQNRAKTATRSVTCGRPVRCDFDHCARPITPRSRDRNTRQNLRENRSKPRRRQRYSLTTPRVEREPSARHARRCGGGKNPRAACR